MYCSTGNTCKPVRLGCVLTGARLLIGQRSVVVRQTGRPHAGDVRASRPRTPQGQVNHFGHITLTITCVSQTFHSKAAQEISQRREYSKETP